VTSVPKLTALINIDLINIDEGNAGCHTQRMNSQSPAEVAPEFLTATQAAARLGVKQQTVYAYVSRGVLTRRLSLDGRTSLYDPTEIDELRSARRRTTSGEVSTVIASSITKVSDSGHEYRGVLASELLDHSFEQVVELLWGISGAWSLNAGLLDRVRSMQDLLGPDTPLIDRLRLSVTVVSAADQFRHDPSAANHCHAGRMMLMAMVDGLPTLGRPIKGNLADRLWGKLTTKRGTPAQRACLNSALILLADHGLAASTFAARIAASVRADPYSIVHAGLGAVGGPLHGAASEQVHRLLDEAADVGPERAIGQRLANHEKIPGAGHLVYRTVDPRDRALMELITEAWASDPRLKTVLQVREILADRIPVPLNVDSALAALTWLGRMDPQAGQCIFVSRTAGWIAHGIEEFTERPIRFRPVARWVPPRERLPEDA
jgi:citrate synthase